MAFGGKIRVMSTASAAASPEVLDFFKAVLSIPILEAYA